MYIFLSCDSFNQFITNSFPHLLLSFWDLWINVILSHESVLSIHERSVSSSGKAIDCIVITWAGCNPTHQTIQPTTSPWQSPSQTHRTFTSCLKPNLLALGKKKKKKTMLDTVHYVDCCESTFLIGRHDCPSGDDSRRVADSAVSLGKTVDCIVISKRG